MLDMGTFLKRLEVEKAENWRDIVSQVPYIAFPYSWKVAIVPPFAGAVARFLIRREAINEKGEKTFASVSVYLDWHSQLGSVQEPYYELYPAKNGDTDRFLLNDTDAMIEAIEAALTAQEFNRWRRIKHNLDFALWRLILKLTNS